MTFYNMIIQTLDEKKISKSELANRLGISRQSVHTILNYYKDGGIPKIETLKKFCNALDIKIEDILSKCK